MAHKESNQQDELRINNPLWTTIVKKDFRPKYRQEANLANKPGITTNVKTNEDTRIFLRYPDKCPDAAAVRHALQKDLPTEAMRLIKDIRNTRKAIAIYVSSKEDQDKLRPFKDAICKAAKCTSADVTQRWERLLVRGIKTKYVDLDMKEVTIDREDIRREVGSKLPYPPRKF